MLSRLRPRPTFGRNAAIALLVSAIGIVVAVFVANAHDKALQSVEDARLEAEVATLAREVQSRLGAQLHALDFISNQSRIGHLDSKEEFELAAEAIANFFDGFVAINWVDADRRIAFVWPPESEVARPGELVGQSPSAHAVIDEAKATKEPRSTTLEALAQGDQGVATYFPVWAGGEFKGYINGVFGIEGLRQIAAPDEGSALTLSKINVAESAAAKGDDAVIQLTVPLLDKYLNITISRAAGPSRHYLTNSYFQYGVSGSILAGFLLFIGLRNRTERLRQHTMLSTILTAVPDAILTIDESHKIIVFNPAAEAMFGRSRVDMMGQPLDRLLPEQVRPTHDAHICEFEASSAMTRELSNWRIIRGRRANGEEFPVMLTLSKTRFENRLLMTAVMRDMTQVMGLNQQLERLAEDLMQQVDKAQAANKAKTTFLATMSHELRTPLNAIIGFSEFMQTEALGPLGNPKYREYMNDIHKSGHQLLEIINDILDLSKVEAGAYRFELEMFVLAPVLKAVRGVVVTLLMEKNIDLTLECDETLEAYADKRATRQILINLVSNAIKFTPFGGKISISARPGPGENTVECQVSDSGCGISPENLGRIWEPFVQVGDAYRAEVKGTGLGLTISRSFAHGMNGQIEIESKLGVGTTVRLWLPTTALAEIEHANGSQG